MKTVSARYLPAVPVVLAAQMVAGSLVYAQQLPELRRSLDAGSSLPAPNQAVSDGGTTQDPNVAPVFGDPLPIPGARSDPTADGAADPTNESERDRDNALNRDGENRVDAEEETVEADPVDPRGPQNTRERAQPQAGILNATGALTPVSNTPVEPIEGARQAREEDPFAPIGIRRGAFTFLPTLQQELGYTSNGDAESGGQGSVFALTRGTLEFQSDLPRHELRGQINATYQEFFQSSVDNLPTVDANTELRLDVSRDLTARFGVNYNVITEAPTSNNLDIPVGADLDGRPLVQTFGGFAEIERSVGRTTASLRGTVTRGTFGDVEVVGLPSASQNDRNNTRYELRGRVEYETSPAYRPFAELTVGHRSFDETVDRNGNRRDSITLDAEVGVNFDFGEKLSGTLGLGYAAEFFDDSALGVLQTPVLNGSLVWSPERLTTITANATTGLIDSINQDESGGILFAGSLEFARDVRPNFSINARLAGSFTTFDEGGRSDVFLQAETGVEWRVNRMLAVIGRIGYDQNFSNDGDSEFNAFTAQAGIRVRR